MEHGNFLEIEIMHQRGNENEIKRCNVPISEGRKLSNDTWKCNNIINSF